MELCDQCKSNNRIWFKLGKHLHDKGIRVVAISCKAITDKDGIGLYVQKQIDSYLQDQLKPTYPFLEKDPKRKKLCCWFEASESVLLAAYQPSGNNSTPMSSKKGIKGGRGFGLFFTSWLDYVEKLQNYDWVIVDLNIFDAIPGIEKGQLDRDKATLASIFKELTRLTQEHYILGYPYPLAEAHNFISLKKDLKEEIVSRLKYSLYKKTNEWITWTLKTCSWICTTDFRSNYHD